MIKKTSFRFLFLLLFLTFACNGAMRIVNGKYTGHWGETVWTYDFAINGTYSLQIEGQTGNLLIEGQFVTANEYVLLQPDSAYTDLMPIDRLLKTPNGCLKDLQNNFYCKSEAKLKEALEAGE
jgi:hypothetical protein